MTQPPFEIWTIGHSAHPAARFVALLAGNGIGCVVDVRRHPVSRRHPQFGARRLALELAGAGIGYVHLVDLGGHREPLTGSHVNAAWREEGLRGYADWARGPAFRAALERLCELARQGRTAIMCAEGEPIRCHRRILADHLLARGGQVHHIMASGDVRRHEMNEAARIWPDGSVTYPARQARLFD